MNLAHEQRLAEGWLLNWMGDFDVVVPANAFDALRDKLAAHPVADAAVTPLTENVTEEDVERCIAVVNACGKEMFPGDFYNLLEFKFAFARAVLEYARYASTSTVAADAAAPTAAVRVCGISDAQCSRNCGTGACKRESPTAAADAVAPDRTVDELAMLVKKLAHSLRRTVQANALADRALDYLRRHNLIGSPLRGGDPAEPRDDSGRACEYCNGTGDVHSLDGEQRSQS